MMQTVPIWMQVVDWTFTMIIIIWGIFLKETNTPEYIKRLKERRKEQGI